MDRGNSRPFRSWTPQNGHIGATDNRFRKCPALLAEFSRIGPLGVKVSPGVRIETRMCEFSDTAGSPPNASLPVDFCAFDACAGVQFLTFPATALL
jgi:hypothetical protein